MVIGSRADLLVARAPRLRSALGADGPERLMISHVATMSYVGDVIRMGLALSEAGTMYVRRFGQNAGRAGNKDQIGFSLRSH